jgi:hypothetical protein
MQYEYSNVRKLYAQMRGLCMMNADKQTFLTQTGFIGISTQTSGTTPQERKPKSPESNQSAGAQGYQEITKSLQGRNQ